MDSNGTGEPDQGSTAGLHRRAELFAALLLSLSVVLTAWAAFQSTKWSGEQANNYSNAGAARIESTRASTEAGQLSIADVTTFTAWMAAISAEHRAGMPTGLEPDGTYTPEVDAQSGFLYERFRPEFRPAVDAWLATHPLTDPAAPRTPFVMPEYHLAAADQAAELQQQAEEFAAEARQANQYGDNYVLMTIVFAVVLFFAGVSSNLETIRARVSLLAVAAVVLVGATVVVATFPVQF